MTYTSELLNRENVAEGTMSFHFRKPDGFEFRPGQWMVLTLENPPETDAEGNIRTFSIASAPYEPALMVATRMRDTAFKRVLRSLPLGTGVKLDGPGGSLTLQENADKPAVFLAGGIGITPFLSVLRQAAHTRLPRDLHLFYSNRRPEDAPFLDNLQELARLNPNFHLVATMTEMSKSSKPWSGETGFIDGQLLSKHLASLQGPIYYVAGPGAMVVAMRKALAQAGVDKDDVRSEVFAGY